MQLFVDLVARHEERFYHFVHQVHSKGEGLFDNLMSWIELFINFVRDGLPSPVSLDFLLPVGGKEREDVLAEVDALVDYHRKLKLAHHERMKKRLLKGRQDTDKDVDAAFVAGVMDNLHISSVMDDVQDVEHEESEDEGDDYSTSESDDEEDEQPPPPLPAKDAPLVPPRPPKRKSKKDREIIDPPTLKHIPQLVPIFVELVRPCPHRPQWPRSLMPLVRIHRFASSSTRRDARSGRLGRSSSAYSPRFLSNLLYGLTDNAARLYLLCCCTHEPD